MPVERPLHFVFPDGILAYDCVECGARCCRGHNSTIDGSRELVPLLVHRPELAPFVFREPGRVDEYAMLTFAPACVFLGGDNRCGVELELGRATKPVTCRLFPVDRFSVIGRYLFVDVHFLCPLGLLAYSRPTAYPVDHATTVRDLAEVGSADVLGRMREEVAPGLDAFAESLVAIESDLRDRVIAAFETGDLAGCLAGFHAALATRAGPAGRGALDAPPPAMEELLAALDRYWGIQRPPLAAEAELRLRRNLLGLACSVHHKVVSRQPIASEAQLLRWSSRLPALMAGVEFLFRNVVALNPARNAIDPLKDIVIRNAQNAYLLGAFLRRPVAAGDRPRAPIPPGLEATAAELMRRLSEGGRGTRARATLGELLTSLEIPARERTTVTRWLAGQMEALFVWEGAS